MPAPPVGETTPPLNVMVGSDKTEDPETVNNEEVTVVPIDVVP